MLEIHHTRKRYYKNPTKTDLFIYQAYFEICLWQHSFLRQSYKATVQKQLIKLYRIFFAQTVLSTITVAESFTYVLIQVNILTCNLLKFAKHT